MSGKVCLTVTILVAYLTTQALTAEPALNDDAPQEVRSLWEKILEAKPQGVTEVKMVLAEARDAAWPSEHDLNVEIRKGLEATEARLVNLQNPQTLIFPQIRKWSEGEIGKIGEISLDWTEGGLGAKYCEILVIQIINNTNAIVRVRYRASMVSIDQNGRVTGEPGGVSGDGPILWISGVDTSDWNDGSVAILAGDLDQILWKVVGTKEYEPANGEPRTVPVIMPFDITPYIKMPEPAEPINTEDH